MASKNLVLKGATWNGVESVDFPVSGGGTARYVETSDADAAAADIAQGKTAYVNGSLITGTASGGGGDPWSWMGKNPTKAKTVTASKTYLKDTPFATWTPSTTSETLITGSNISTETVDLSSNDCYIVGRFHTHFEYEPNTTQNNLINDYYYVINYNGCSYPSNLSNITDGTGNVTDSISLSSVYMLFYKNGSGNDAVGAYNFGFYVGTWNAVPSANSSGSSRVFTLNSPSISARCSNTYFTTANAAVVDMDASYYEISVEIWTVDKNTSSLSGKYQILRDNWLNGF